MGDRHPKLVNMLICEMEADDLCTGATASGISHFNAVDGTSEKVLLATLTPS